jgi:hypothetical protein
MGRSLPKIEQRPALRISHIVYGREAVGNRVSYLVDPRGKGFENAIPETVVLKRWRQRQFPGHIFEGTRLSSTLWRSVHAAFPEDAKAICSLDRTQIEEIIENKRFYFLCCYGMSRYARNVEARLARAHRR